MVTNTLVDVAGLQVGHADLEGEGALSGTTVVLPGPEGAVAGVDVRGGGPGTRETDALDPRTLVERVHAVVLTGGSAYGLAAASGVADALGAAGRGFPVGARARRGRARRARRRGLRPRSRRPVRGPPDRGDRRAGPRRVHRRARRPRASSAPAAARSSAGSRAASAPRRPCSPTGRRSPRSWSRTRPAPRSTRRPASCGASGTSCPATPSPRPCPPTGPRCSPPCARAAAPPTLNTTIGVVATDAGLSVAQCAKLAAVGHDGLARAVRPVHGMTDGDTLFGLATAARPAPDLAGLQEILTAGAGCVTRAVVHAVLAARSVETPAGHWRAYRDLVG